MTVTQLQTNEAAYRRAISRFASGVTVVTAFDRDGVPRGMTASAVTSLSLQPLQLLVCISTHLPTHAVIADGGRFAVNVLGEDDEDLAMRFAEPDADRFAGIRLREEFGAPVLDDAIAVFDCELAEVLPGGDHSIFIGRVQRCEHDPEARPLVYWGSQFAALA